MSGFKGFVQIAAEIGKDRDSLREIIFLVDTGAFYTILSSGLASELRIETPLRALVMFADGRTIEIGLGVVYLRALDREGGVPVGIMDAPMPLLGATALGALGLKVNPVDQTLEHARPFGPAVLLLIDTIRRIDAFADTALYRGCP
jgi:predicted aspartyl protease